MSHPNAAPTDWVAAAVRALTAILAAFSGGSAVNQTTLRRALASWKFADRLTPDAVSGGCCSVEHHDRLAGGQL